MSEIIRITKDGLLSIAGMLIEDPALDRIRIDPAGNLYTRMIIEDPALTKVEWGRDGIVRCRMFWEGGLWTSTPPPISFIYVYPAIAEIIHKMNTELETIPLNITGFQTVNAITYDDNYIYIFSYTYTKMGKINRTTWMLEQIITILEKIKDVIVDGNNLVGITSATDDNRIIVYNKSGQRIYSSSNIFSNTAQRIYKHNDKFYVIAKTEFSYIKLYELNANYQILRQTQITLDSYNDYGDSILVPAENAIYLITRALVLGAISYAHKIDLNSLTVVKTVNNPLAGENCGLWSNIMLYNNQIYISGSYRIEWPDTTIAPCLTIYRYSLNLDLMGFHRPWYYGNPYRGHGLNMCTDGINTYVYAVGSDKLYSTKLFKFTLSQILKEYIFSDTGNVTCHFLKYF